MREKVIGTELEEKEEVVAKFLEDVQKIAENVAGGPLVSHEGADYCYFGKIPLTSMQFKCGASWFFKNYEELDEEDRERFRSALEEIVAKLRMAKEKALEAEKLEEVKRAARKLLEVL